MPLLADEPARAGRATAHPTGLDETGAEQTTVLPIGTPVFVDPSGRRRTLIRIAAVGACLALLAYASLLIVALVGGPIPPHALLPLSGQPARILPPTSATAAPSSVAGSATRTTTGGAVAGTTVVRPAVPPPTTPPVGTTAPSAGPPVTTTRTTHAPITPPGKTKHPAPLG